MNKGDHDEVTFEEKFNDYGDYDNNTGEDYRISGIDSTPNYDYEYEDDDKDNKELVKKTTVIMLGIILLVIIILILLKACSGTGVNKGNNSSESLEDKLIKAGKDYFSVLTTELPDTKGTCNTVSLDVLTQLDYLGEEFNVCDKTYTYVKACMLNNADIQYTPFMSCEGPNNTTNFGEWKPGDETDLTKDKSDVKFLYTASYIKDSSDSTYGKVEEFWKNEIPYDNYKTISSTNYYRYRDKEYIWMLRKRYYYPGDVLNASDIDTYYIDSPSNKYVNKTGKTIGYRWYTLNNKVYYPTNDGYAYTAPNGYPLHDDSENVAYTFYYTRTWNEVAKPTSVSPQLMYMCVNPEVSNRIYNSYEPCSLNSSAAYNYGYTETKGTYYTCDGGLTKVDASARCLSCPEGSSLRGDKSSCGSFSSWSSAKINNDFSPVCDVNLDTCTSRLVVVYRWYKADIAYIGNESPTGQSPYYTKSPQEGAVKDVDTAKTVYKWYKLVDAGETNEYSSVSPAQDATKTSKYKWGEWTNYSSTKPKTVSGSREIQKKVKVKLKRIITSSNSSRAKVTEDYVTEEELIKKLRKLGYEVNSISDASNIGEVTVTSKMYYRDRI